MFLKRAHEEIFKSDVDGESVPPPSPTSEPQGSEQA